MRDYRRRFAGLLALAALALAALACNSESSVDPTATPAPTEVSEVVGGGELGHLLEPEPDAHPNDDGYRVIADAFLVALGLSTAD